MTPSDLFDVLFTIALIIFGFYALFKKIKAKNMVYLFIVIITVGALLKSLIFTIPDEDSSIVSPVTDVHEGESK